MKIKIGFIILTGLVFYFLNTPSVSAKNGPRDHRLLTVATASPTEDIDHQEKDLGRGESPGQSSSNRPDVDSKEKDLGRGEPLNESSSIPQDLDSSGQDLGQGEPFIQSDTLNTGPPAETVEREILVGSDFTDAIKGKNFTDPPLRNSITLQTDPSVNDNEINFKNNPEFFEPETLLPPKVVGPEVIDPASSSNLPEVILPE